MASASITTGTVSVLTESTVQDNPRYSSLLHDTGSRYFLSLQQGFLDVFEDDAFVAGVYLPTLTPASLPFVNFYAENATLGIGLLLSLITHWVVNAILLKLTDLISSRLFVKTFGTALIAALVMSIFGKVGAYVVDRAYASHPSGSVYL